MSLPDGSQRLCARRTIEDWWYDYRQVYLDANLQLKESALKK